MDTKLMSMIESYCNEKTSTTMQCKTEVLSDKYSENRQALDTDLPSLVPVDLNMILDDEKSYEPPSDQLESIISEMSNSILTAVLLDHDIEDETNQYDEYLNLAVKYPFCKSSLSTVLATPSSVAKDIGSQDPSLDSLIRVKNLCENSYKSPYLSKTRENMNTVEVYDDRYTSLLLLLTLRVDMPLYKMASSLISSSRSTSSDTDLYTFAITTSDSWYTDLQAEYPWAVYDLTTSTSRKGRRKNKNSLLDLMECSKNSFCNTKETFTKLESDISAIQLEFPFGSAHIAPKLTASVEENVSSHGERWSSDEEYDTWLQSMLSDTKTCDFVDQILHKADRKAKDVNRRQNS